MVPHRMGRMTKCKHLGMLILIILEKEKEGMAQPLEGNMDNNKTGMIEAGYDTYHSGALRSKYVEQDQNNHTINASTVGPNDDLLCEIKTVLHGQPGLTVKWLESSFTMFASSSTSSLSSSCTDTASPFW